MDSGTHARLERELTMALKAEAERLRRAIRRFDQAEQALGESQAEESDAGGEQADVGSDLAEQEIELTLARAEHQRLIEVEAALLRIAEDRYGRCQHCGIEIPADRLRALPWTAYCHDCAVRYGAAQPPSPRQAGLTARLG